MKNIRKAIAFLLTLSLLFGLLPIGALATAAAQSFRLGSTDMLAGGGTSVATPEGVFFSDASLGGYLYRRMGEEVTLISTDCGRFLNYDNGTLFYAVQDKDSFTVWAWKSATGEKTACMTQSGTLSRMYTVNGNELYYQIEDSVWQCSFETGQKTCLLTVQSLWSFVPTAHGLVYATGSLLDYAVYAGQTLLAEHADDYYFEADVDGGTIVYSVNGSDWQMTAKAAFSGKTQAAPFEGYGQIDVSEMLEEAAAPEADDEEAEQTPSARRVTGVARRTLSSGQTNIVKRAMQMATIQWTPVSGTVPKWGGTEYFTAGTTYTGLPYGQPVYASYVPWSTGLSDFLTYVNDSGSKMYTSTSTYNKTAPYYSCDCSAFVSWAWKLSARQTTSSITNFATLISSSSYANAQVGDCLNCSGSHVVLISDITYDAGGSINGIRITECTPPLCKSTWYGTGYANSLSTFSTKYFSGGYSLYRSNTRDSVTYTHCCAVPLDGDICALCGSGTEAGTKFGIDVSHWQGNIDWAAAAGDIDFAILRSSYGTSTMDTEWEDNVNGCTNNSIPFGVYVYGRATSVAQAQAEANSVVSRLAGYRPTLPVFYDFEDSETLKTLSKADILTVITAFCDIVEAAGYTPGVYANTSDWNTYLTSAAYNQWVRWVAQYSTSCTYTGDYSIWQYSDAGSVSGIAGNVDLDRWYGDFPSVNTHTHSYSSSVTSAASCMTAGVVTYSCSCGASYTETIPATGHTYAATSVTLPTCTDYASATLTCSACGSTRSVSYDGGYSDWITQAPAGVSAQLLESKTQYRYADAVTTTSYAQSLPGYTLVSSTWEQSSTGSVQYAAWPSGFDTADSLYQTYNRTPAAATETATAKTVINSDTVSAWLYYHWCRGSYTAGPINRKVMPYYVYTEGNATNSFVDFAAYLSTTNPASITANTIDTGSGVTAGWGNDTAYFAPNSSACQDSYWYFAAPVHTQRYTDYRKLFTYQKAGAWSAWSDTVYTATGTRQVETRTVYRFSTAPLGHSYAVTTTAATCTTPEQSTYCCTRCQDSYSIYTNAVWSAWTTTQPAGGVWETRTVSRYTDYGTTTSYATSMTGYTQLSSVWEVSGSGSTSYVAQWPAGFDTSNSIYGVYHHTPVTASETATAKTVVNADTTAGWVYWHWCRGVDSLALGYDRKISTDYTSEFNSFDAFYSTTNPSTLPYTESGSYYTYANSGCCGDTARYYALAVNTQSYTTYRKLFTFGGYGAWSAWSEQSYEASATRQVETRTEYRVLQSALYGEHSYVAAVTTEASCIQAGVMTYTCANCAQTYTAAIPVTDHTDANGDYVCDVCGLALTAPDYSGRYYIAAHRTGEEYYYLNSTVTSGRLGAISSGLSTVCEAITADVDTALSFLVTKVGNTTYTIRAEGISGSTGYLTGSADSTAMGFDAQGTVFTILANANGSFKISNGSRNLCLSTSGSYAFAMYAYNTLVSNLSLIPVTGTVPPAACLHENTTTATVAATCTAAGSVTVTCLGCGAIVSTSAISAFGHSYSSAVTTAASCTQAGVMTYTCANCADTYTEAIPAADHADANGDYVCDICGLTLPSPDYSGSYYIAAKPTSDNYFYMTNVLTSGKLGAQNSGLTELPTEIADEIDSARVFTLTKTGSNTYTLMADGIYGTAKYLTGSSSTTTVSLTEEGTVFTLTVNAEGTIRLASGETRCLALASSSTSRAFAMYTASYLSNLTLIPVTGAIPAAECTHESTTSATVNATCTTAGSVTVTCDSCGETVSVTAIPATGHTSAPIAAVAATCTAAGSTAGARCSVCSAILTAPVAIAATGHSYSPSVTTAASCAQAGVMTYTCAYCADTYTEKIPATGHTSAPIAAVAATCTAAGSTAGARCSVCSAILTAPTAIAPLGHALRYTAGACATHGVACSRCNYTQSQPHSFVNGVCSLCNQKGGSCGTTVSWYLREEDGELIIDGTGEMSDYVAGSEPWFSLRGRLRHVTVNSGVTKLGKLAFYATNIQGITIADTVTEIGSYCFSSCRSLTSLELPQSITTIGRNAFVSCTNLTSLTVFSQAVELGANLLLNCAKVTVYGESSSAIARYAKENGVAFTAVNAPEHLHEFTDGICSCGLYGGSCGEQLTWILDINTGVLTVLGSGAMPDYKAGKAPWFAYRGRIRAVMVEEGVTTLGKLAFYATNVSSIEIAETVGQIGGFCFSSCPQLLSVTLPASVEQVGQNAFVQCTALQSVTVRNARMQFGKLMFLRAANVTLYGAAGSTAEQYAAVNSLAFEAVE